MQDKMLSEEVGWFHWYHGFQILLLCSLEIEFFCWPQLVVEVVHTLKWRKQEYKWWSVILHDIFSTHAKLALVLYGIRPVNISRPVKNHIKVYMKYFRLGLASKNGAVFEIVWEASKLIEWFLVSKSWSYSRTLYVWIFMYFMYCI